MKLAVVKIGARIAINGSSTSGGTGETLSIISLIIKAGYKVDAYTKILDKDQMPSDFNILNIETEYTTINNKDYDCLIVLNGNANFFGGCEDINVMLTYDIINNFNGKIFYILCDPNLTLKQIWKSVQGKVWGETYSQNNVLITRKDISILTQSYNIEEVKKLVSKNNIDFSRIQYFPFEKFPLYTLEDMPYDGIFSTDVSYGGTFRNGKREDDMIKYYFNYPEDINVEMFGKITIDNFNDKKIKNLKPPIFNKSVKYDNFSNKMKESLSTVIIGDILYKKLDDLAQRIYESIRIGNIVFIDSTYDKYKRVFKNSDLRDLCYVESKDDVINRIRYIKKNPNIINSIITAQRKDVEIDINDYLKELKSCFI